MDVAYDQVQESAYDPSSEEKPEQSSGGLNNEFQQAFKAVQSSPWGATLGGWFSQARKQGETLASEAQEQATKGWEGLREQVTQRTTGASEEIDPVVPGQEAVSGTRDGGNAPGTAGEAAQTTKSEIIPKDIVKEAGTLVASLRLTAAATLKDLQAAEDAADEALLKFGTNVRNFLRDAVVISAPTDEDGGKDGAGNEVLFETQEPGTGKKIFHTTRLDAQLHAIHTTVSSFTEDPSQGAPWEEWQKEFDIEKQTDAITQDLEKFADLKRAMEKLVPEKVEYKLFWTRYYFLRKAVEEEEKRRREVLKEEEVAWDDEDDEGDQASTPNASSKPRPLSTATINAASTGSALLTPNAPRRSHEDSKSVAGSEASYDIVSGATSHALNSPKEEEKKEAGNESEDDDWE
nr:bsd domain-containing protein c22a12.14c [Quercus suber]